MRGTARKHKGQRRAALSLVFALPVAVAGLAGLARATAQVWQRWLPRCPFLSVTGLWCPACGNTRSVLLLLRGDIAEALRHNITPVALCAILALLYVERALAAFGRPCPLLPRSARFWFTLLGLTLLYYAARNFIPHMLPL